LSRNISYIVIIYMLPKNEMRMVMFVLEQWPKVLSFCSLSTQRGGEGQGEGDRKILLAIGKLPGLEDFGD
jgi:hypothetical protein